jgi:hypothetical protein
MPKQGRKKARSSEESTTSKPSHNSTPKPIFNRGRAQLFLGRVPSPHLIPQYVTASWAWTNQSAGEISWTFVNSDPYESHTVVLYRNGYIFGGAFWPIYLGPNSDHSMLDGTKPIAALTVNDSSAPMGILDFDPSATTRYLVAFIFTIGPGRSWSICEGGFTGVTPTAGVCYELVSKVAGDYCVGYDPTRVYEWNNEVDASQGYSPNPKEFSTYAFTPEPGTPEQTLGLNDSIASGACSPRNFYFGVKKNHFGRDEVLDVKDHTFYLFLEGFSPNAVGASVPSLSGSFNATNIPGLVISGPTVTYALSNTEANATRPQQILFGYEIHFTAASLDYFPSPGSVPSAYILNATISFKGQLDPLTPQAEFFLWHRADTPPISLA